MSEWQTMDTAPFGVDVLVATAGGFQQVAMQVDFSHWADRNGHYVRPLFWQSLPRDPEPTN